MNEHLIGVQINDQKAQLQKVLEEVRIANDGLSKTFAQIAATKEEHVLANQQLAEVRAQISTAVSELQAVKNSCEITDRTSKELAATALKDSHEAHQLRYQANEDAKKILADANGEATLIRQHIEELQGFTVTAEQQADVAANELGSLELAKQDTLKNLRELEQSVAMYDGIIAGKVADTKKVSEEWAAAAQQLAAVHAEKESIFAHLTQRETAVAIRENDTTILQSRLYGLLKEEQSKL